MVRQHDEVVLLGRARGKWTSLHSVSQVASGHAVLPDGCCIRLPRLCPFTNLVVLTAACLFDFCVRRHLDPQDPEVHSDASNMEGV